MKTDNYGRKPIDYTQDPQIKSMIKKYSENYEATKKQQEVEERRRFPLEMRLKEHIVGQESAISTGSKF